MDQKLAQTLQSIKRAFPVQAVYVLGSYARGDARSDSDLDLLIVYAGDPGDLFELAYEIRSFLHERFDLAIDVVVTTTADFKRRQSQPWTIEYTAHSEGIAV